MSEGTEVDLEQLAAQAAGGDTESLDRLLAAIESQRLARGAIRRLILNDADAEDAHQDVLIAVSRGIGGFRGDARFTTWLAAIARNVSIGYLRRRREHEPLDDDRPEPYAQTALSSMIATRSDVRAAVAALPEHYRSVIELRDIEGHSYNEVAQRLGLEIGTVRSRLARGRAMVAASAAPDTGEDGAR